MAAPGQIKTGIDAAGAASAKPENNIITKNSVMEIVLNKAYLDHSVGGIIRWVVR